MVLGSHQTYFLVDYRPKNVEQKWSGSRLKRKISHPLTFYYVCHGVSLVRFTTYRDVTNSYINVITLHLIHLTWSAPTNFLRQQELRFWFHLCFVTVPELLTFRVVTRQTPDRTGLRILKCSGERSRIRGLSESQSEATSVLFVSCG